MGKKVDKFMVVIEEFLGFIDRKEERRKSSIICDIEVVWYGNNVELYK